MKGDLSDFHLSDLIQICCQHPVDARLDVRTGGVSGSIYFSLGEIFHSVTGGAAGKAALLEILGWRTGAFELQKEVPPPERTIHEGWASLVRQGPDGNSDAVRRLRAIDGVEGAELSSWNGEVLAEGGTGDSERLAGVASLVGATARQAGAPLGLGSLRRAVVDLGPRRVLVLRCGDSWASLCLAAGARPDRVCADARKALGEE